MRTSDNQRPPVTPTEILGLFLRGVDTVDIAERFQITEPQAYKLLRFAIEARRLFNGQDRDPVSAVNEPPVEGE